MRIRKLSLSLLSLVFLALASVSGYFCLQKEVFIVIDGKQQAVHTFKKTVNEVIKEANIPTYAKDRILPGPMAQITDKETICIIRAVPVTVQADGKKINILTVPISVREILKLAGITLGNLDYSSKALNLKVAANEIVKVVRVKQVYVKKRTVLGYTEEHRPDPSLDKGITHLLREGSEGLAEKTVCITYEDGKEVNRTVTDNKIVKKPLSRLIAMGTISSISRGGRSFDFDRVAYVEATAYSHTGQRTATGVYPQVGTVAVDPSVIPLGSQLYVEGYGYARAQDVGGAIIGKRIDVFLDSVRGANRWGRRRVKVYIKE